MPAYRRARATGATRAPDAVHIVFGMCRYIKIEHMADIRNIQAPRGDIAGDEIFCRTRFELIEHFEANVLVHIAMQ